MEVTYGICVNCLHFQEKQDFPLELAGKKLEHGRGAKGLGSIFFGEQEKKKPRRKSNGHSQRGKSTPDDDSVPEAVGGEFRQEGMLSVTADLSERTTEMLKYLLAV